MKLCSFGSRFESGCFPLVLGSGIQCISGSVFRARLLRGNARAVNPLEPGSLNIGTTPGLQHLGNNLFVRYLHCIECLGMNKTHLTRKKETYQLALFS